MGASTTPDAITRTNPLSRAYAPANSFPLGVLRGSGGLGIRGTRPGGLVLGTPASTFAWADIVAYMVGIAVGNLRHSCF